MDENLPFNFERRYAPRSDLGVSFRPADAYPFAKLVERECVGAVKNDWGKFSEHLHFCTFLSVDGAPI